MGFSIVSVHDAKTLASWGLPAVGFRNLKAPEAPGLYIRGNLDRAYWFFRLTRNGVQKRKALGVWPEMGIAAAVDLAESVARQVTAGFPLAAVTVEGKRTWRDAIRTYQQFSKGQVHAQKRADRLLSELGDLAERPISKTNIRDLQRMIDGIAVRSRSSAYAVGGTARAVLHMAIGRGWAAVDGKKLRLPHLTARRDVLDEAELSEVFAALPSLPWQFHAGTLFQAALGCRLSEAFTAEWADIDLPGRRWNAPAGKMKMRRSHSLWLNDTALLALSIAKEYSSGRARGYVFSDHPRRQWSGYPRAKSRLKRAIKWPPGEPMVLHDLRRSIRKLPDVAHVDSAVGDMILAHSTGRNRTGIDASYNVRIWADEIRTYLTQWDDVLRRCGAHVPRPRP